MLPSQYSVQQTNFQSPPVLYSQSQPMMVSNQNNMTYQMVNLGAGAIAAKMQQRQQEEMLIDLLSKQSELITQLSEVLDWRVQKKEYDQEQELEELERKQIIMRQKKAEQDYLYKLNRQLNFGLERIREQEIKRMAYPRPVQLGVRVPSIAALEAVEQVYPNPRFGRKMYKDREIQADSGDEEQYSNPYGQYDQQLPPQPAYQPQFNQDPQRSSMKKLSQSSVRSQKSRFSDKSKHSDDQRSNQNSQSQSQSQASSRRSKDSAQN